jgi:hypothetical protein
VAEIVNRTDLTQPGDDGWKCVYEIKRADGGTVTAEVGCTRTAGSTASAHGNAKALESMRNYGGIEIVQIAEKVQSPARRGATHIVAYYDAMDDGSLRWDVAYEREPLGP